MNPDRIERFVWPTVVALLAVACALVLRPFFSAILWAAILSFTTWPLYVRLRSHLGGHAAIAATLMTTAIALLLLVPIGGVAIAVVQGIEPLLETAKGWAHHGIPDPPGWLTRIPFVGESVRMSWAEAARDGAGFVRNLLRLTTPDRLTLLAIGRALLDGTVTLILSTVICWFLYRDGDVIAERLRRLVSRLAGVAALRLVEVAENTIRGVVYGILGTAVAQAVLQTVGLLVAGVPGALLLGGLTFFLSVVPVGPPVVWLGAGAWLYFDGQPVWAAAMLLWGVLVVSSVDNVVKPYLISRGARMPFVLVLLGVLGGVLAFGFIGVFIGPTLLAVAYRLVLEWSAMRRSADGPPALELPVPGDGSSTSNR